DELLRAGPVEIDSELRVGAAAFHRQDRPFAELIVTDPRAALELCRARLRSSGTNRRRIELHRCVLEKGGNVVCGPAVPGGPRRGGPRRSTKAEAPEAHLLGHLLRDFANER